MQYTLHVVVWLMLPLARSYSLFYLSAHFTLLSNTRLGCFIVYLNWKPCTLFTITSECTFTRCDCHLDDDDDNDARPCSYANCRDGVSEPRALFLWCHCHFVDRVLTATVAAAAVAVAALVNVLLFQLLGLFAILNQCNSFWKHRLWRKSISK